jgi:hypothetical protein
LSQKWANFPVFSRKIGNGCRGDEFADDCFLRQLVCCFSREISPFEIIAEDPQVSLAEFSASDCRERSLEIADGHWGRNSPFGNLAVRLGRRRESHHLLACAWLPGHKRRSFERTTRSPLWRSAPAGIGMTLSGAQACGEYPKSHGECKRIIPVGKSNLWPPRWIFARARFCPKHE